MEVSPKNVVEKWSHFVQLNSSTQNAFSGWVAILLLCQRLHFQWSSLRLFHFCRMLQFLKFSFYSSLIYVCRSALIKGMFESFQIVSCSYCLVLLMNRRSDELLVHNVGVRVDRMKQCSQLETPLCRNWWTFEVFWSDRISLSVLSLEIPNSTAVLLSLAFQTGVLWLHWGWHAEFTVSPVEFISEVAKHVP